MTKNVFIHIIIWSVLLVLIHLSPWSIDRTKESKVLNEIDGHDQYANLETQPVKAKFKYQSKAKAIPESVYDGKRSKMEFDLSEFSKDLNGIKLRFQIDRFADGYALSKPFMSSKSKDVFVSSIWVSLNEEPIVGSTWGSVSAKVDGGSEVRLIDTNSPLVLSSNDEAKKGDSIRIHFGDIQ